MSRLTPSERALCVILLSFTVISCREADTSENSAPLNIRNFPLENGVAVIPGLPFYADNFVRLSYAISIEDIKEGFDRIELFVSQLV